MSKLPKLLAATVLRGNRAYSAKVLAIQPDNLIAYWPQTDAIGTTAGVAELKNGFTGTAGANVTFGAQGISSAGKTAALHAGTTAAANIALYSTGLRDAFDPDEITISIWAQLDADAWADTTNHGLFILRADVNNRIYIQKNTTPNNIVLNYIAGGTTGKGGTYVTTGAAVWNHYCITVSKAADEVKLYVDGDPVLLTYTSLGTWVGDLATAVCWIGGYSGIGYWSGKTAHTAVWSKALTPAEVASLAVPFDTSPSMLYAHCVGDSKTAALPGWPDRMNGLIRATGRQNVVSWITRHAGGGATTQEIANNTPTEGVAPLVAAGITPDDVCINLGANDANTIPVAATWKQSMKDVIEPYHAAFPACRVRIGKIWKRNTGDQAASIVVMNAVIDELYTEFDWLYPAMDEADFLPGSDDGATYTSDGVHPTEAGYALEAAAWVTAMGY